MRQLYIILLWISTITLTNAQTIDNGGFEDWVDSTNFFEPEGWRSSNRSTGNVLGGVAILPDSNSYSGDLAAQVQTVYIGFAGDAYAGVLTNGSYDTLGISGPAINYKPQKLTGYYKFSGESGDSALVILYLNKYSSALGRDELVAGATVKLPAANDWTYFEGTVLDVFQSAPDPESFAIVIVSTKDAANPLGGDLRIDALEFSGVSSVNDPVLDAQLTVYPNPANDDIAITMKGEHTIDELTIYNGLGQIALHQTEVNLSNTVLQVADLPVGMHVLQIKLSDGSVLNRTIQIIH